MAYKPSTADVRSNMTALSRSGMELSIPLCHFLWKNEGASSPAFRVNQTGCAVNFKPSARATFRMVSKRGLAPGASAL